MGYETTLYVVCPWRHVTDTEFLTGQLIAMVEMSKCGYAGPFHKLIVSRENEKKPTFAFYARNPDRQQEAVELLREVAERKFRNPLSLSSEEIDKLSNDIEDGYITKDCYGSYLGMFDVDEIIEALEEEIKNDDYRRYKWALVLLKAIKETWTEDNLKVVTYGH